MTMLFRNKINVIAGFMAMMLLFPLSASAEWNFAIAHATRIKHSATLTRAGVRQTISLKTQFQATDKVETGPDARLEITFEDGTTLTLGEKARLTLDDYVYDPVNANNHLALALRQGAFLFVSGLMGKQPDRDMKISTPLATIGIRGTKFWGGSLENPLDVLLLEGKVVVTTPKGTVTLDEKGKGTSIPVAGEKPTVPKNWPHEKQKRAFATITF